jgi:hypothetical protein
MRFLLGMNERYPARTSMKAPNPKHQISNTKFQEENAGFDR